MKDLISAAFILGSYSFFLALVWAWLGAVDLAFVEAVVGAGLATVFFLLTLFQTDPRTTAFGARLLPWPLCSDCRHSGCCSCTRLMIFPNSAIRLHPLACTFPLSTWRIACKILEPLTS